MITARPQKDLKAAKNYFREHLAKGDYYSEGKSIEGRWVGKGIELLGLNPAGPVTEEAYSRLCDNQHPVTGERLTARHRVVDRRVFYDFVVSAPKSVSVLALVAGDGRILTAHDLACRKAMERMEQLAATRGWIGRRRGKVTTGVIAAAEFRHDTSRALDPQLHTHFVVFNATWDRSDQRWKALETSAMFDQITFLTEVYRSELALRLRGLGYGLRNTPNGFEIEGVAPSIIDLFSKRRRAIAEAEARITERLGKPISNNARAAVAHDTRQAKRTDLSDEQVRLLQRSQLSQTELEALRRLVADAASPKPKPSVGPRQGMEPAIEPTSAPPASRSGTADGRSKTAQETAAEIAAQQQVQRPPLTQGPPGVHGGPDQGSTVKESAPATNPVRTPLASPGLSAADRQIDIAEPSSKPVPQQPQARMSSFPSSAPFVSADMAAAAVEYAKEHLFERNSVVPLHRFLREALVYGRGAVGLQELEQVLAKRTDFIQVESCLTTRETLIQEQRLLSLVNQGIGRHRPLNPTFRGGENLTHEQSLALRLVLRSPDEVISVRGRAGTGKTRVLREIARGIEERQGTVVLAPTAAAVEVLRKEGLTHAATVQRFLADPSFQNQARAKVLVVDEASFLSVRDALALTEATRTLQGRLILVGDTRQHSGVEAGDALRLLETRASIPTVRLSRVQRQVDEQYREAISELSRGQGVAGLQRLERIGAVEEVADSTRYQCLAREYIGSLQARKTALVVSPTWREIGQVTDEVRTQLKAKSLLAPEETLLDSHQSLKWTRAQKRDLRNYAPGMVVAFHKPTKEFTTGERGEVVAVGADNLQVRKPGRQAVQELTRKQADCFDVSEPQPLAVAAGERLLVQGNRRSAGLFNGQIVTVKKVRRDGSIALTDGRIVPADFRSFTYGYCVTSHAAQGRTVDHVYVAVDSKTQQAANINQLYVSTSRGREKVKIFTDDVALLREAVTKSAARLSATELLDGAPTGLRVSAGQREKPGLGMSV